MTKRTLKLTHEEITLITSALNHIYSNKIKLVNPNSIILSEAERTELVKFADKFVVLAHEIEEGIKDV